MEWKQIFFQNISTYLDIINNFLSKSYSIEPLGSYVKVQGGYAFKNSEYKTTGTPIIRISDFQNERIVLDNTKFYDEKQELSRYELKEGDIIIAMTGGTIGKLAVVQEGLGKIYLNQRVGKFEVLDKSKFHKEYVYWIARGVEEKVKRLGYGGAQPNVSNKQIENLQFPFPKKETQKSIVTFLNDFMNNKLLENSYFDKNTENLIFKIHNISLKVFQDVLLESDDSILNLKKLKEAILQEAVQGKLVEQNSKDEPASVLLEKIKKEKEQLIKEKKIKKEKPLPEITKDEIPYGLPNGWEWVRLGDITNYGSTKKIESKDISPETWILDLEDIEKTTSKLLQKKIFSENPSKSSKNVFEKGDVLYSKLRPYLDKVLLAEENGVCTSEILPIRGYFGLNPRYLRYFLKSQFFLSYVNELTYGVKMPRLGTIDGKNAMFPLPPLEEQKRIVERVDSIMAFCDELEQEINKSKKQAEQLMQSVLKEAFEQKEELLVK